MDLFVKGDLPVQMFNGYPVKVFPFLSVVRVDLGHRGVQDCLASRGLVVVGIDGLRKAVS